MLYLIFAIFCLLHGYARSACPNGTIASFSNPNNCYLFVTNESQFITAEGYCRQRGGHLASILNAFDNMFLSQEASTYFTNTSKTDFWIGATNDLTPGKWEWLDGSAFDFTDWDKGQPQNATNLNCLSSNLIDALWSTQNCFMPKPFACLIPTTTSTTSSTTTTTKATTTTQRPFCSYGYTYSSHTGYCYKAFSTSTIWSAAESQCQQDNAHLTSLHSQSEADFVLDLVRDSRHRYRGYSPCWADQLWIGLYTLTNNKDWVWTDGTPVDFLNWAGNEPNNPGKENCVQLILTPCDGDSINLMNNIDCNYPSQYFVCKKPKYT